MRRNVQILTQDIRTGKFVFAEGNAQFYQHLHVGQSRVEVGPFFRDEQDHVKRHNAKGVVVQGMSVSVWEVGKVEVEVAWRRPTEEGMHVFQIQPQGS